MTSFTETVRAALIASGWEIYADPDMEPPLAEWWWKPVEHRAYWNDGTDNYMLFDQAVAWQMMCEKHHKH